MPRDERSKMDPKSVKCIFLGYGDAGEMGYRLWDPQARKVIRSHDVVFHEDKMHRQPERVVEIRRVIFQEEPPALAQPVGQPTSAADAHGQGIGQAAGQAAEPAVRRSTRDRRPPNRFQPSMHYVLVTDVGEPFTYDEAMRKGDSHS